MIEKVKFINAQNSAPVAWYKGDKATTMEFYSGLRKAKGLDPAKAQEASVAFGAWQNDPTNEYYSPYLYNMTNMNVAQGIYDLTGRNYSKGITQKDIDELKPYADYSNIGINNTPNKSGTNAQMLAYWLYQAEKDEATTQAVEAEMQDMDIIIKRLVDDGYSDDYITNHLDMERYPNLAKMTANAKLGAPTPLNRPVGYSDDYMYGSIWAAHNGGTSGNSINDIANYQDKVGNMYKPNAESEAARDPSSDNYHPYSHGATLDWLYTDSYPESGVYDQAWFDANVGMKAESKDKNKEYNKAHEAHLRTERAKAELEKLKGTAQNLLGKGKTADEVYEYFFGKDGSMKNMEEDYATLVSMEEARRKGTYVSLTDTVDFAAPYFKQWLVDTTNGGKEETINPEIGKTGSKNGAESIGNAEAPSDGATAETAETVTEGSEVTDAESENLTAEEKYPMPPMNEVAAEPTANFDVTQVAEGTPAYEDIVDDLTMYRRGAAPSNPDAAAFIQQFPYLFAGDVNKNVNTTSASGLGSSNSTQTVDMRDYAQYDPNNWTGGIQKTPIADTFYSTLLKRMDEAQKSGIITQSDYVRFLFGMGNEIAKSGNNLKSDLQNGNSEASAFGKEWNDYLSASTATYNADKKAEKVEWAKNGNYIFGLIDAGQLPRDITEEAAAEMGISKDVVDSYYHAYDEIYTREFTSDDLKAIDPNGFQRMLKTDIDVYVAEELSYSKYFNDLDEYAENEGAARSEYVDAMKDNAVAFIDTYVQNLFTMDARKAAVFGVQLEDYYESIGITRENIDDYRENVIAQAVEAWDTHCANISDDMASIVRAMTEFEAEYDWEWQAQSELDAFSEKTIKEDWKGVYDNLLSLSSETLSGVSGDNGGKDVKSSLAVIDKTLKSFNAQTLNRDPNYVAEVLEKQFEAALSELYALEKKNTDENGNAINASDAERIANARETLNRLKEEAGKYKNRLGGEYAIDRTFTDAEIDAAVEDGAIEAEDAASLKEYQRAMTDYYENPYGTGYQGKADLEYLLGEEKDKEANELIRQRMVEYLARGEKKRQTELEEGKPTTVLKAQATGDGAGVLWGFVTTNELGFKQHTTSWCETFYAFTRKDAEETERNYRTKYSREEVRKNIEAGIMTVQDKELREALLEDYYNFTGDIYDFDFDFESVNMKNLINRKRQDIELLKQEMQNVMTNRQFQLAINSASAVNSFLFSGEAIAVSWVLGAVGMPHAAAGVAGAVLTSGVNEGAAVKNEMMDNGVSSAKSNLAMMGVALASGTVEGLFDINLSPVKFGRASLTKSMRIALEEEASESLFKAFWHKAGSVTSKVAMNTLEAASAEAFNQAGEIVGEVLQEQIATTTKNVVYASEGMWDKIDRLTWDEVFDLAGDSAVSGIIQRLAGLGLKTPKNMLSKRADNLKQYRDAIGRIMKLESLNAKDAKAFLEGTKELEKDPAAQQYLESAAIQAEIDNRVAEKVAANTHDIVEMPEYKQAQEATKELEAQNEELKTADNELKTAGQALMDAQEQLQTEEIPMSETIFFLDEVQKNFDKQKQKFEEAKKKVQATTEKVQSLKTVVEQAKQKMYDFSLKEATAEVMNELNTFRKEQLDAYRQQEAENYNALLENRKRDIMKNLQENYGFTDKQLEKLDVKAKERIETQAQKEATGKDELLRLFQQKLPAYKVMYKVDTGDAAGWVVRQGGEGTLVLNPNIDYDTLTGALSAHELVHVAEDSAVYNDLVDVVKERYFAGDENKFNSAKTALNKDLTENEGRTLSDAEAGKEVIAEAIQDMFSGRGEWVKQIVAEKPNLAQRMFEWVKNKVDEFKLRRKETKDGKNADEVNEAVKTYRQYVKIRRLLRDALSEAGKKITMDTVQDAVRKAGDTVMNRTRDLLRSEPNVQEETTAVAEAETAETPIAKDATVPKAVVKDDAIETEEVKTEGVKKSPETRNAELARKRYPKLYKDLEKYAVDVAGYADINTYAVDNGFANADELVEYEAQFDYDDYNTEEENAIIEEANKDAEEYMSVTENEELTDKSETAAEEEVTVAEETDVADTKAEVPDTEEEGAYSEKQLVPQNEVEGNWIDYFTKERGEDLNTGHQIAEAFGFDGTWDFLSTVAMYPVKWFKEFGLENFKTADDFKQAAENIHQKFFDQTGVDLVFDSEGGIDLADVENAMKTTPENGTTDVETDTLLSSPAFEFASKRRIEAAEKARKAARLLKDSAYFRETGDWANYQKSLMQRMGLGEINKKLNTPDAILKGLASKLGIGVYTGTIANGKHFAAYDARASALISDNKAAASDYATFMYSIGEKLKKIAGITDPSEDYALGDFMFDYMLQKDADFSAATRAYAKEFREKLKAAGSDFAQAIENARDKLQTFKYASAIERVNAFLVSRADKKKEGIGAQLRKLAIGLVDQTLAAEIVDETTGSHALREAAAYLPYARRRVERNIEGDTFVDVDGNRTGGYTLKTALADIKENELEAFEEYLFAREAVDRYEMGKAPFVVGDPASITLSQAKETVATLEQQHPNFKTAGQKYNEFWDNFMQTYVVGEGFLSQEEYEAMRAAHPNYVPFTREHTKNPSGRYASGANDIKFYRAVGNNNRKVYYPLENAIAKINQFTNRAMQNRFARVFDELYQANDDLGFIAEQLPLTVESMIKVVPDGITAPDELMEELAGAFADKDKTEVAANSNNGTKLTVVRQDGTRVTYDIQDKPLFDLLSGSSVYNQIQGLEVGEKVRIAVAFVTTTMAKLTTGSNPLFMVRNFARDFQKSVNYGSWASNYLTGLLKMIKGLPEYAFKLTEKAKDFDALGGGEWERLNVNTTKGVKQFKKSLFADDFKRMSAREKAKRIVLSPLRVPIKVIDWFGTNTEAGMRYMEYAYGKHNLSTAKGRQKAFMAAMESTVDFQRSGNQSRWLKAIVPFANATLQGNYQNLRMFTDAEKSRLGARLTKMILNNALLGAIETIINVHWGRSEEDREKYLNMPLETKQKYFMLPLDDGAEREFAAIPISQDWLSRICFEFGRKAALGEYEEEDGFAKDIATLAFGLVTEMITETTTIASPFFDVLQNENYYGSPIVKQSLEDYLPEARYDTTTADAFKSASNFLARGARRIGISADSKLSRLVTPLALEYLAEQYTGVYGQLIIPSISFNKYTGKMGGLKAVGNVVRNRFTLDADSYNVITDRFYDICDTVTQMQKHIDSGRAYTLNPDLTEEEVSILFDEVADSDNKGGAIYEAKEISKECENEIGRIMLRDDLTDHEKNVLIEEQYEIRNAAFMNVVAWFDPIQMQIEGNAPRLVYKRDPVEKRISNLPEAFKVDYENGEAYMLEAERLARLPSNSSKTTILPKPNMQPTRTINGISYEYDLENDKRFKDLAEEYKERYYGDEFEGFGVYANEIISDPKYEFDYDDEEKTTAFRKAGRDANELAKEWLWEQIDMMEEDKENEIEKYEGMTKGKVK